MHCLNCGNTYKGNYCPHCGQKAKTKRLNLFEMVSNLVASFVGGDNMFLNTCRDLVQRPGHMVRSYLQGKRARYYNPLQMYVFTLTAYAIVSYIFGASSTILDDMFKFEIEPDKDYSETSFINTIIACMQKIYSNKLYGALLSTLFSVPAFRWFFRKCKVKRPDGQLLALNYTEHFCTQMYFSCLIMIISIIMLPLCLVDGMDLMIRIIYQGVSIVYIIFLYKQLLRIGWLKSLILNTLAMVVSIIFLGTILALFFIFAYALDYYFTW